MQVAGDLVRDAAGRSARGGSVMPSTSSSPQHAAAKDARDLGIVVAGDPDPLAVLLQDVQDLADLPAPMRSAALASCRLSPRAMTVAGVVAVDDFGEARSVSRVS